MKKVLISGGAALLALAASADERQTRMMDMRYVDEQQCFMALDNRVLAITPMLALAWLEATDDAARKRARDAFYTAIERGCDINAPDLGGMNALNLAIVANNAAVVTELLTHGADPARVIESRDTLFNGKDSFTLLDALAGLDESIDRTRVKNALATRKKP